MVDKENDALKDMIDEPDWAQDLSADDSTKNPTVDAKSKGSKLAGEYKVEDTLESSQPFKKSASIGSSKKKVKTQESGKYKALLHLERLGLLNERSEKPSVNVGFRAKPTIKAKIRYLAHARSGAVRGDRDGMSPIVNEILEKHLSGLDVSPEELFPFYE